MDYILKYTKPKSDQEKKIVAKITVNFDNSQKLYNEISEQDYIRYNGNGNGILEGLPTPYTNLVTNQPVPNTGTIGPVSVTSYIEVYGTQSVLRNPDGSLTTIGINKMYQAFIDTVKNKLYHEYKKVYGLELYQTLSYETGLTTLEPVVEKIEGSSVGQATSGVTASGQTASTQEKEKTIDPPTSTETQTVVKISGEYIFDITKDGYFINKDLGELKIVSKEEAISTVQEFDFGDEELTVSEEYAESEFFGDEESYDTFIGEEMTSNSSENINQEEPTEAQTNFNTTPSDHLKPSKSGFLQGDSFTKTIASGGWRVKVNTNYALTSFKYGKPKITQDGWIKWKKEAEGGIANGTTDSAYKTYGEKTIVPISTGSSGPDGKIYSNLMKKASIKDKNDSKKYDSICTNSSGKRLYNIHTNKGILYTVWKNEFCKGGDCSIDLQKRYLQMNDDDWWRIMKKRFYDANRGGEIDSLVCRLMWISWCWGSGTGGAIINLNTCLNLLAGEKKFTATSGITSAHIKYMNSLPEDKLISAMYDVRCQFFLNISQPESTNKVYRNGWINGLNKWIDRFHDK